ncbi:MAG: isochorismatase family protein [Acetobacter sp.]|nr:isochorismatase family protein [Acetobacter sp.]
MLFTTPNVHDALLIVDVQNDFLTNGALAITDGNKILPCINALAALPFGCIITSQDWHPPDHFSFNTAKPAGPWPRHCVANTYGAALAPSLHLPDHSLAVFKGMEADKESYSAFEGITPSKTTLLTLLQEREITRVFICGLALDYCVKATALDARNHNINTVVIINACQGLAIDPNPTLRFLRQNAIKLLYFTS